MKKVKITKEQYNKLVKSGMISESTNIVDKTFKKALAGKDVYNLKYIPEERIELASKFNIKKPISGIKNIKEEVNNLLEYIYGLTENFSTFWEDYDLTYEDLCETLESKGYLIKKEGTYKVSKKMGDAKSVKESMLETITEMLRPIEEDYPAGAESDPNAPWNRQEPKMVRGERPNKKFVEIKYRNPEIAIFRDLNSSELYTFYYGDIDTKLLEPYADRYATTDADGDLEYDDYFEIDADILENYVNDNFPKLTKGVGLDDFESGNTDLVLIDEELKDELLHLYDKDSRIIMVLSSIAEVTAATSSGSFVGVFSPSDKAVKYDKKKLPPVVAETDMTTVGNIGYDNPGFAGISRDGKFPKNPKPTKAQKNTQWAGGAFVKFDDCTKLNNNKEAQKGKCSTGAADNVVKLVKTKSNINAPSLSESRIMREALKLQHDKNKNKLVVLSDLEGRAGSQETFHNKSVLKQNGFIWSGTNWIIDADKLEIAKKTLSLINKAEYIIDKLEDLEEAVENSNADNKDFLKARLDQYIMDLANATDEVSLSAEIRRYLTFFSKFHGYSYYNRILIFIQKPNATKVGSFKLWESKHRRVKKGSKAIKILAPAGKPETIEYDDQTSELMRQLGIENKPQITKFKAVNVFDISDTEPIDERGDVPDTPQWWGENTPSETAEMLYTALTEVAADLGVKITQSDSQRGEKGYSTGTHINISSDVKGVAKLSVAIHELAHDLMHWKKSSIYYIDNGSGKESYALGELQAESVSYVVLKHYGIPATHHATYLALWKANKDRIQKNIEIISKVSQFIIDKIDEYVTKG